MTTYLGEVFEGVKVERFYIKNQKIFVLDKDSVREMDFVEDQAFVNLISLKQIFTNKNRLEYQNREGFFNTTNLDVIDFSMNGIKTIPRGAFANT